MILAALPRRQGKMRQGFFKRLIFRRIQADAIDQNAIWHRASLVKPLELKTRGKGPGQAMHLHALIGLPRSERGQYLDDRAARCDLMPDRRRIHAAAFGYAGAGSIIR